MVGVLLFFFGDGILESNTKSILDRYRMNFENHLREQLLRHPAMQPQDVVKMCYQAAHGAEHVLTDVSAAEKYFYEEFEAVEPREEPLYEEISGEICRVNFAAWKACGMDPSWLLYMFTHSVGSLRIGEQILPEYLDVAQRFLHSADLDAYVERYTAIGMPAVHHSEIYRTAERPAYRIISSFFIPILPILQKIAQLPDTDKVKVIALDGRAAAGKSTVAAYLADVLGASLVYMDDFFLPPELRSAERFSTPGGNVHHERFCGEVLPYVADAKRFFYRVFDCRKMDYVGQREVPVSRWRIVEGAYSCHPVFGDYADVRVFFDVDPDTQMQRIIARNGAQMAEMFQERWIPLEEAYYRHCRVKEIADLVVEIQ